MKGLAMAALMTAAGCAAEPDETPDAGNDVVFPGEPDLFQLSKTGHDVFYGAAYDDTGRLLAVGFRAEGIDSASDRAMVVARFTKDGELDPTFGSDGVAVKNVKVGGNGETARGIIVQSTGKIVIGGTVEGGTVAGDRDVALVRFNTDGTVDETFGAEGVVVLDFNVGHEKVDGGLASPDNLWNLVASGDQIVVHGNQRAQGTTAGGEPREDNDWVVVRLTADGALDDTFGTGGKFTLDIDNVSGNARAALVLADGSVIGTGYSKTPSAGNTTQAVVYKVDNTGKLDTTFGVNGVFHDVVLPETTEIYALAQQGDKFVSTGYGRPSGGDDLDWVSLRLNADGSLDTTWGDDGAVLIDYAGFNDNARNLVALPDGRFVMVGGGRTDASTVDAMVAVLKADGTLDTSFHQTGKKIWDLGGLSDMFWGVAVSPIDGTVAVVGAKAVGAEATAANNDDAAVLFLSLGK